MDWRPALGQYNEDIRRLSRSLRGHYYSLPNSHSRHGRKGDLQFLHLGHKLVDIRPNVF